MSVLQRFRSSVVSGALRKDAAQEAAVQRLQHVADEIEAWRPGLFARRTPPRGLYLWGDVGRGKSMLMDLFFESVPVAPKRRVHFNAFMAEAHALLHEIRQQHVRDPIPLVARRLEQRLLCFDELQIEDVADAMIIGRLFEQLFARGCVVVATSNTAPDRLYQHGLNRQLFLPFIASIKQRMEVVSLMGHDYRRGLTGDGYHVGPDAGAAMDAAWTALGGAAEQTRTLTVLGRSLRVPRAVDGAARFTFKELCDTPLAAPDYLALADTFPTLLIDDIPVLTARDPARRFTILIDTLYDKRVRLICSAAAEPDGLNPGGEESFQRTASRLLEMRSNAYIAKGKP
jgi:cell division protein ZapE